ncbi:MAG: TetR/AcrR family transcriptional regulator [Acidimicrobiia bacterium]|nr:TetR/AcrR family transcriptional regulator [Acidimicrobiia bacterium]
MAETRDRIIVATNELFRRHGYNGTSLSQISEAANATIGSIYHFFPGGKEALAVAVIETTGTIYRELFESIAREAPDPASAYVDFFAGAAAVLEESDYIDPCPIGTVAREVANTSEPLRIAAAKIFDSWINAVTQHLVEAGVCTEQAAELGQVFVATVEGMFVLSRTQRSTASLESAGRSLGQLVTQAIDDTTRTPTS